MSKINLNLTPTLSQSSSYGLKNVNPANIHFRTNNPNRKQVKRVIAFSSLDNPHSNSLGDFRSEVLGNLNKVKKFSIHFSSSPSSNKTFTNTASNLNSNPKTATATTGPTDTTPTNKIISPNNSNNNSSPSLIALNQMISTNFNNNSSNSFIMSKDPFVSQSVTKFFQDEKTASVIGKADLHKKIMEIGDNLHGNLIRDLQLDYDKRLRQRESEISDLFKREREMQVEKERKKFSEKLESIKAQLKKDYERLLRERASEIEIYTQNVSKEQIELNKIEAKRILEDTVRKQREQFEIEKFEAVEEAILKEKQAAEARLEEQRKRYESKYEDLNEKWVNKLNMSLQEHKAKFNKEIEKTIQLSCEQVASEKNLEIERLKDIYENKLDLSKFELQLKLDDIAALNSKLNALNYENDQLKEMIEELKEELAVTITRFSHLKKNDNDFLFPVSLNGMEIKRMKEKTAENINLTKSKK